MRYNFYIFIYIYLCKKVFFSRKIFQHKTFFSILKDFFSGNNVYFPKDRSSHQRCSVRKGVVRNFTNLQKNICARVSFLIKFQASGLQLY